MRIWSVHPSLLDRRALVACWRETLLAQKVLAGETKGYKNHPQLERFRACQNPLLQVGSYLSSLEEEAQRRGYRFDRTKILQDGGSCAETMPLTSEQLAYEFDFLCQKVRVRDPSWYQQVLEARELPIQAHPLFSVFEGPIESWEKVKDLN